MLHFFYMLTLVIFIPIIMIFKVCVAHLKKKSKLMKWEDLFGEKKELLIN